MNKMKRVIPIFALLLVVSLLIESVDASAVAGGTNYTYTYDCWYEDRESPDAYAVTRTITGTDLPGCGNFKAPESLYVRGNKTYVVDTGNNRIVELEYKNDSFIFSREIKAFNNEGTKETFNQPKDVYVTENGDIYVADYGNKRVLHMNNALNIIKIITKPNDETFSQAIDFLPSKLVVDKANRIFVNVTNVNKGFMEFDSQGSFSGYVGASEATFDLIDYLWKLVATKAQRQQMINFVPTEYSNLCLDSEDFIYATITKFDVGVDEAKIIRKLNAKGTDILVRNGYEVPMGDYYFTEDGELSGPSKFFDVCTLPNDTYYCIDNTRGRIFGYDFQGNMLYAFGGHGYREGYFINPVSIEDLEDTLLVLDSDLGSITQFTMTNYGALISQGLSQYKIGEYEQSAETWKKVMRLNGNYDLAYIGVGRALLRTEQYEDAMNYFKLKLDTKNYSKAYKLYRKEWIEDHIMIIVFILIALILLGYGRGFYKKAKKEVNGG